MGAKIARYFSEAAKIGGAKAKMRLSMITRIPSVNALEVEDSPERLIKFEKALEKIQKEFLQAGGEQ